MFKKLFGKSAIGIILSLSLMLGVAAIAAPHKAEAAYSLSKANSIIATGKKYLGTPYLFGASSKRTDKFDCSSFIQRIYKVHGVSLPRTSKAQSKAGKYVSIHNLKPGDLVFFYSPIHHVAIYIGNGKIMHTYGKPGVTISSLKSGWWRDHYATARRVL